MRHSSFSSLFNLGIWETPFLLTVGLLTRSPDDGGVMIAFMFVAVRFHLWFLGEKKIIENEGKFWRETR